MTFSRAVLLPLSALVLLACAKPQPAPAEPQPGTGAESESPPPAEQPQPAGTSMTAAECEAQGGKVVGDIGDGAIHRPDYVCPESGQPPLGTITPEEGGPVAVEGSVCCGA
jgi:hypothetical protein